MAVMDRFRTCPRCGGRRRPGGLANVCSLCWNALPKHLRDAFRRAVATHDDAERDRLRPFVEGAIQ